MTESTADHHESDEVNVNKLKHEQRKFQIKVSVAVVILLFTLVSFGLFIELALTMQHLGTLCSGIGTFVAVLSISHVMVFSVLALWVVLLVRSRRKSKGKHIKWTGTLSSIHVVGIQDLTEHNTSSETAQSQDESWEMQPHEASGEPNKGLEADATSPRKRKCCSITCCIKYTAISLGIFLLFACLLVNLVVYALIMPTPHAVTARLISNDYLNATVSIDHSSDGMLHIKAQTLTDAYFAQGMAVAQQRLWQMEFQRRIGFGRLAEIIGDGGLSTDIKLRTMGVGDAAKASVTALLEDESMVVEVAAMRAYTAGVNAYLDTNPTLPLEFLILGASPEPWTLKDSAVWFKVMALDLSGNLNAEMDRLKMIVEKCATVTRAEELVATFDPKLFPTVLKPDDPGVCPNTPANPKFDDYPKTCDTGATEFQFLNTLAVCNRRHARDEGTGSVRRNRRGTKRSQFITDMWDNNDIDMHVSMEASNNWVTSATASTLPLLANDPHLRLLAPSIWIMVHMEVEEGNHSFIGATFAGAPGIVIGHNNHIAWGVTNSGVDVQDSFIFADETIIPTPFTVVSREEVFLVNGVADKKTIRMLHGPDGVFGPIISDNGVQKMKEGRGLALKWTAISTDFPDYTFSSFIRMSKARTFEQFRDALRLYVAPIQSFVFASTNGDIGFQLPGKIPIRDDYTGKWPTNLSNVKPWRGFMDFDDLPSTLNPPRGFIASANNQVVPECFAENVSVVSCEWGSPGGFRAMRIEEMLRNSTQHTLQTMAEIQLDYKTLLFTMFKPILNMTCGFLSTNKLCDTLLGVDGGVGWDGNLSVGSHEGTVFEKWYVNLTGIATTEVGNSHWNYASQLFKDLNKSMHNITDCCGVNTSEEYRTTLIERTQMVSEALDFDDLPRWGVDLHFASFTHTIFNSAEIIKCIGNRETQHGGDGATVNVGGFAFSEDDHPQTHGPSYRHIVDMGALQESVFLNPPGQSGVQLSSHYDDMLSLWSEGKYVPMRTSDYDVEYTDKIEK
eukprot:m.218586 g.218586  ORF g.218586 m.218586 type:complete len:1013 (-) comp33271_c0_seq2:43-3081(-)